VVIFHDAHFSDVTTTDFGSTFVEPKTDGQHHGDEASYEYDMHDAYEEQEGDEDDLGYYPDGVKRTLTDEEIQIFRHSELEALRRRQEKLSESAGSKSAAAALHDRDSPHGMTEASGSDTAKGKAKKKKKNAKRMKPEPKPDLRKRTWDVVEAGLDTLDYD
jgi:hypothetical protein